MGFSGILEIWCFDLGFCLLGVEFAVLGIPGILRFVMVLEFWVVWCLGLT